MEPDSAGARLDLGNACRASGKLDEAMAHYARALELEPGHAGAHINIGNVFRLSGRLDEAAAHYAKALDLQPRNAGAHVNLGSILRVQGKLDEALWHFRKAIELEPRNAGARLNIANVLHERGELDEAAAHYQEALALRPDAAAQINLGNILQARGKFEEAIEHYAQALAAGVENAGLYHNLGAAIVAAKANAAKGNLNDAAACFAKAIALEPHNAETHYLLGNVFGELNLPSQAVECYERALALAPDYADAHTNLMITLRDQGRTADALACCQRAISVLPDLAEAHFCEAYLRLLTQDWNEGWRKYEWRWRIGEMRPHGLSAPLWNGEDLRGGAILLHCEQGLGDCIQFVRYAPMVKKQAGRVLLSCPASLARLFEGVTGVDEVISEGPVPGHDVRAPLLSLPGIFQTTLDTMPAQAPYLRPDSAGAAAWKARLAHHRGFKVGVCWRGRPTHPDDRKRSMTAVQFAALLDVPTVAVVSLQKDATAGELETLGGMAVSFFDASPLLADFSETAAVIANLDLVIAVDTAVCHLAGALAAPVWTLLPFAPDWRWLLQREDSPWYPSMRLFRQPNMGDWQSVIERVRAELAPRSTGKRK